MTEPTAHPITGRELPWRPVGVVGLLGALLATACVAATPDVPATVTADVRIEAADPSLTLGEQPTGPKKEPTVGGLPLFSDWPKDRKPDAVIVFSGQSWGFLQPCGCSRPQVGGLERRAVFIDSLRAKGWPVAGVDLGDIFPDKPAVWDQGKLKYVAAMNALREMGYIAVGVGRTEIQGDLYKLIAEYALQKEQPPFTLAGNAQGVTNGKVTPREQWFAPPQGRKRALVELIEVAEVGTVPVGVAGVVGKTLKELAKKEKLDPFLDFGDTAVTLKQATTELAKHPKKPQINILLYQGTPDEAAKLAADWPQFHILLCQAESDNPPMLPEKKAGKKHPAGQHTLVVQVGHKGQNIGVMGAFKKQGGGYEFKYQLVPMGEDYITPGTDAQAAKINKVLPILDEYAKSVKANIELAKHYPRRQHHAEIRAQLADPKAKLSYVGSEACRKCHEPETKQWDKTPHAHAMDALEKKATRPTLRQYDGECVKCHSVGFEYKTGYADEKLTPHLKHVGCESCHGPGSGHAADPTNKTLLALQSPWKQKEAQKLPDAQFMEKMAKLDQIERGKIAQPAAQLQLMNAVSNTCMTCHDHENDPHFDLYKYWPKVNHTFAPPPKPGPPPKK